ncbi:MAG: protein translocase subunit SecD [Gammaproteobacteria bacterium]|nr:protein translocase subunit SecD [Gammaproteobacteria bacterium]
MNRNPLWKWLLAALLILGGAFYALPNWFGDVPAVQVSVRSGELPADTLDTVTAALADVDGVADIHVENNQLVIRTANVDQQLKTRERVIETLDSRYITTLNLVSASPKFLRDLAKPMSLGLDLRGGVHFLMDVDLETALNSLTERQQEDIRGLLRDEGIRYAGASSEGMTIRIGFRDAENLDLALNYLSRNVLDFDWIQQDDELALVGQLTEQAQLTERKEAVKQNIVTLRNRVNELGVSEPVIQQQGEDRIVVQLPGIQDTGRAKLIIGATATLEYRLAHGTASDWYDAAASGNAPAGTELFTQRDSGQPVLLKREVIVTGDQVTGATSGIDSQSGSPAVFVNLDGKGARRMQQITSKNINKPMAVLFIEDRTTQSVENGQIVDKTERVREVISVATIRDTLSNRFQTTGLMSEEARDLALLLRAGALRAPMKIVEERTVGPSLGQDNIDRGLMAVTIGFAAVLVFMAVYYKVFGLFANVALTINLVFMIAIMSLLQAVLTMPGIAGIVLTVGMAVDANVLIFERIREELKQGSDAQIAIEAGYSKALSTIADANITTLIAAVVLFVFGTGPIKGFAITLSIGIVTSMVTAIWGTRLLANAVYGGRRGAELKI